MENQAEYRLASQFLYNLPQDHRRKSSSSMSNGLATTASASFVARQQVRSRGDGNGLAHAW
jgi:hypothetical protein